jgi:hypothetical protein
LYAVRLYRVRFLRMREELDVVHVHVRPMASLPHYGIPKIIETVECLQTIIL